MGNALYYRAKSILSCHYWLLIYVLFLHGCNNSNREIKILFTGDILLSRNVKAEIETRAGSPWADFGNLFTSADLVAGNLEGAVGEYNHPASKDSSSCIFDIPKTYISMLKQAGFTVMSVENNHSNDLGKQGKKATINALKKENIAPLYYDNSPQFFQIKGIVIALIAINLVPDRENEYQKIPSIELNQKLRLARNLSNMVIVFVHWGSELLDWPDQHQRAYAEWLVNNGADLIIGCHPHVIQKPEMIQGKPVFYSLGNHLFDQKYAITKEGLMVECRINTHSFTCKGILTHTKQNSFYSEYIGMKYYNLRHVILHNTLTINHLSILPSSANDTSQNLISLEAYQHGKSLWKTNPMPILSVTKAKLDGKNDFLFMLEKYYSSIDGEVSLRPYVYTAEKSGLVAKWRGSALAWPLMDAIIAPDGQLLCALHRGDSFIEIDKNIQKTRFATYRWNGFGFSGANDSMICKKCFNWLNIK